MTIPVFVCLFVCVCVCVCVCVRVCLKCVFDTKIRTFSQIPHNGPVIAPLHSAQDVKFPELAGQNDGFVVEAH